MSYVLCADDDPEMRGMLRDVLSSAGHEVHLVPHGEAALEAIHAREPDLLILDLLMPGVSGLELCRAIKENPFTEHIPVLMLTGQGTVEHKVAGFEAGADEYLAKPFDARELRSRVAALLRLVKRESDRNPTTGLPGGRAIEEEIARRDAKGEPFAICYLDLDQFKAFADRFGFSVADAVIRDLGGELREVVKGVATDDDGAFLGHIGGDDFLVICRERQARPVAEAAARRFRAVTEAAVGEAGGEGSFQGVDRQGRKRTFPLATLSAAILLVDPASRGPAGRRIGAVAAAVKRRAKQQGAGTILVQQV